MLEKENIVIVTKYQEREIDGFRHLRCLMKSGKTLMEYKELFYNKCDV